MLPSSGQAGGDSPELVEAGHELYTVPGTFTVRNVMSAFDGGHVIVGRNLDSVQVTSQTP
jgi:hypothetical protein